MDLATAKPTQPELEQALQLAQAERLPFGAWPQILKQQYLEDQRSETVQELRYHQMIGLVVALLSVLLDQLVVPDQASHGAMLRLILVVPPAVAVIGFAEHMKLWQAKLITGITVTAFACIVVHLAAHAEPDAATRYLMATAILFGGALLIQPYTLREMGLFAVGFCTATLLSGLYPVALPIDVLLEQAVIMALVGGAGLALARRVFMLRTREYISDLSLRLAHNQLEQSNVVLRELSESDSLTGLANRRSFRSAFNDLFVKGKSKAGNQVTVMMIDLDHFKRFNDHHGHQAGDRALRMVARCLEESFDRQDGMIARFGGEEFIAAVRGANIAQAEKLAERVRKRVSKVLVPVRDLGEHHVTCSIGLASTSCDAEIDMGQLIARADRALYRAKQMGRNQVVVSERIELRVDRLAE